MGQNEVRIEQLANRIDLLPVVAGWLKLQRTEQSMWAKATIARRYQWLDKLNFKTQVSIDTETSFF